MELDDLSTTSGDPESMQNPKHLGINDHYNLPVWL
jgi:hypothetical protein